MVVGTVTKGRQSAFRVTLCPCFRLAPSSPARVVQPLRHPGDRGLSRPVIVTEFMHRFYVQEGNKRVSVLKFLDAPTVSAKVTRLYPGTWDSVESRLYWRVLRVLARLPPIRDRGSRVREATKRSRRCSVRTLSKKWPQKKVDYLRHTFLLFKRAYLRAGGDHLDITPADAMLVYLNVTTRDRLLDTPTDIVVNRLCKISARAGHYRQNDEDKVDLVEAPSVDEEETPSSPPLACSTSLWARPSIRRPTPCASPLSMSSPVRRRGWDSLHDQGRQYLDEHFGGIVRTEAFEDCHDPDVFYAAVETAVKHGDNVIFSTSHRLMEYTLRGCR